MRASQTVAQSSSSAVTTRLPSGLKAALFVPSPEPCMTAMRLPFRSSQTCVVPPLAPSKPIVRMRFPSGLKAALQTSSLPGIELRSFAVRTSQTSALPFSPGPPPPLAMTTRMLSGLKVALSTEPLLPCSATSLSLRASQTCAVPLMSAVTMSVPSGLNSA